MLKRYKDGMHYTIPDEWAEKQEKYDRIVEILKGSSPYEGNRATCNAIRNIVKKKK